MFSFNSLIHVAEIVIIPCIGFVLNMNTRLSRVEAKLDMILSHVREKEGVSVEP